MKKFTKINFDMSDEEVYELLPQKTKENLNKYLNSYKSYLLTSFINCESPIEQLMALELYELERRFSYNFFNLEIIEISQQEKISCGSSNYRVDFLIVIILRKHNNVRKLLNIVIECDGHDFHEKTKEQVVRDNKRTRDLEINGYNVLHFSGSEIFNNARKCRNDIISYIYSKYNDFVEEV